MVGSGPVAIRKAQALLDAGARVVIVSEAIDDTITSQFSSSNIEPIKSKYSREYLAGAILVIAATSKPEVNHQIYKDCQQLDILCNVVDDAQHCDFFVPAVVRRGDLQIAVGTEGDCPAYAGHLRKKLESIFTEQHGEFLAQLEEIRKEIIEKVPDNSNRKALLGKLVDDHSFKYFLDNGPQNWRCFALSIINRNKTPTPDKLHKQPTIKKAE